MFGRAIVAGCVLVVFGGAGFTQDVLFQFSGTEPFDAFGAAVDGAGDIDDDGVPDLIVGAPTWSLSGAPAGGALVLSGAHGGELLAIAGEQPFDRFGWSVSRVGDVDGDGRADVAVGAFRSDAAGPNAGRVTVHAGAGADVLWTFDGAAPGDGYGISIDGAGDVNGDGVPDLIAGASAAEVGVGPHTGMAEVRSGKDGNVLFFHRGRLAADEFGAAVAGAGDVDGDGFADVIVGAWGARLARVYAGAGGDLIATFHGSSHYDYFGISVAGAGDVNGDGLDDVVIGAPFGSFEYPTEGKVKIYSVAATHLLHTMFGGGPDHHFGWSVAGAGDFDQDGFADVAAGAIKASYTRVVSGQHGTLVDFVDGEDGYGWALNNAGDVDQDGIPDLIVASSTLDPGSGRATVYRGCGSSFAPTAAGCAPDGSSPPTLKIDGCARSRREVSPSIAGVPAFGVGLLAFGLSTSMPSGCQLGIAAPLVAVVPFVNPSPHAGVVTMVLPVPDAGEPVGVVAQAVVAIDGGVAYSNLSQATVIP